MKNNLSGGTRGDLTMIGGPRFVTALIAFLAIAAAAHAQPSCENKSLQGQYAFKVVGALVGIFDPSNVLRE
jgi:hypothetical protein